MAGRLCWIFSTYGGLAYESGVPLHFRSTLIYRQTLNRVTNNLMGYI